MSKTLEELGYEKKQDDEYQTAYEDGYCEGIVFRKITRSVRMCHLQVITMEELKAIYKYCEDNKWI